MADTNLIEICCIFDEFCKYFEPKLKSISRFCQYSLIKNGSIFCSIQHYESPKNNIWRTVFIL